LLARLEEAAEEEEAHRPVPAVVVVLPHVDAVVHLPVTVDACPFTEELGGLEDEVPVRRHRRPRTVNLETRKEKSSKSQSKISRSRSSCHRHRQIWWT
jgi:hypothetical protein